MPHVCILNMRLLVRGVLQTLKCPQGEVVRARGGDDAEYVTAPGFQLRTNSTFEPYEVYLSVTCQLMGHTNKVETEHV